MGSVFANLRAAYHREICRRILGYRNGTRVFSNADKGSTTSIDLAARMAAKIPHPKCPTPPPGQTAGKLFGDLTLEFLQAAFARIAHLRPGDWIFSASQADPGIARFDQYEHLADLERILKEHRNLEAALGQDYLVTPDIIIAREPVSDGVVNAHGQLISNSDTLARHTPLRASGSGKGRPILHASVSCKWTMRSDRAQNPRTEALNLIRNRKGKSPHIVVVTLEPMPTRLASIAMGTGDIDCTYHAALYEVIEAADERGDDSQADMLQQLVSGRRLRDISDLPFDLAA